MGSRTHDQGGRHSDIIQTSQTVGVRSTIDTTAPQELAQRYENEHEDEETPANHCAESQHEQKLMHEWGESASRSLWLGVGRFPFPQSR